MEKKNKIDKLTSNMGKITKSLLEGAVQIVDQNNDGKFDLDDVSSIAESMGATAKKSAIVVKESMDEKARELERKALRPIFPDSLSEDDFVMTKFIRISEREKKYAESQVCQGSVGYEFDQKGFRVVNIFYDSIDSFGLEFYPDTDYEFYYVDPSDRKRYIALDEYFGYLKLERINELKRIAQEMGAKYFKVTYKEEKTSFSERRMKASIKIPGLTEADGEVTRTQKKFEKIEIVATNSFVGHEPEEPTLKYLKQDPTIQNLIRMRMNTTSPMLGETFTIKLSDTSGIKMNEAVKIDAVLKGLKCSGNATVAGEVQHESRRQLEYEIKFT